MISNILAIGVLAASFVGGGIPTTIPDAATAVAVEDMAKPAEGAVYTIDKSHATIGFTIQHMTLSLVHGRFTDFAGKITLDDKDMTKSSVEFTAKIASIDTDVAARDEHLRSPDFFDAEKYPELTFKSKSVEKHGDGYVLHGALTIKDKTKDIAIPFKLHGPLQDQRGNSRIGVEGRTTINRQDFGITFGATLPNGGLALANDVQIELDFEAVKPK